MDHTPSRPLTGSQVPQFRPGGLWPKDDRPEIIGDLLWRLAPGKIASLREASMRCSYASGEGVFAEGQPADHFWLVLSGRVITFKTLPEGKRVLFPLHAEGDFFGFETREGYLFSGCALGSLTTLRFKRDALSEMCETDPACRNLFMKSCLRRLGEAYRQIEILARKRPGQRIALFLKHLGGPQSGTTGIRVVEIPLTRQDIADYLSLAPETASRCFNRFERQGIIDLVTPKRIRILDWAKLDRAAGGAPNFTSNNGNGF